MVVWFRSDEDAGQTDWAKDLEITVVTSATWEDFWSAVEKIEVPDRKALETVVGEMFMVVGGWKK